jgi:hypothetical protein
MSTRLNSTSVKALLTVKGDVVATTGGFSFFIEVIFNRVKKVALTEPWPTYGTHEEAHKNLRSVVVRVTSSLKSSFYGGLKTWGQTQNTAL